MSEVGAWTQVEAVALARAAALIGIGRRGGQVLTGLNAVRQARDLALIVVEDSVAAGTRRQLAGGVGRSARLLVAASLSEWGAAAGAEGVQVVGLRRGPLASGVLAKIGI